MKIILTLITLFLICACSSDSNRVANKLRIEVGDDMENVLMVLKNVNAKDISSGMQAENVHPNWMWHVEKYDISLETQWENGKITALNIWDWKGRKLNSYHHTMEYYSVKYVTFEPNGVTKYGIINTHNKGKL